MTWEFVAQLVVLVVVSTVCVCWIVATINRKGE